MTTMLNLSLPDKVMTKIDISMTTLLNLSPPDKAMTKIDISMTTMLNLSPPDKVMTKIENCSYFFKKDRWESSYADF